MEESCKDFDLSALTFQQFLAFFFDRPVVDDGNRFELFWSGIDSFVASNPGIVVAHVQAMCRDLAELTKVYSSEQLNQGLWAMFGAISCEQYLFDPTVDSRLRIGCVESMYLPFEKVVTHITGDIRESSSFYWMWWDMILHTFWLSTDHYKFDWSKLDPSELTDPQRLIARFQQLELTGNYSALTDDQKVMADAMFQTLSKILAIDSRNCQHCALHGLGHLNHPLVRDLVQRYLDEHRRELSDKDVQWIEWCRDGTVM